MLLLDTHVGHEDPGEVNQCSVRGSAEERRRSQRTPERLSPKTAHSTPIFLEGMGCREEKK